MDNFHKFLFKLLISLVTVTVFLPLAGCDYQTFKQQLKQASEPREVTVTEEGFSVYTGIQPGYYGASPDSPVVLTNNESAGNPTWHELKSFLIADTTDKNEYLPGIRVCSEFAAELHNNAEKAGIRAAWVALDLENDSEGHALNAFETTDQGLVFIDCTGGIPVIEIPAIDEETGYIIEESRCFDAHDKKAYVQIGRQCGFIGLEIPSAFDYDVYLDYTYKWDRLRERFEALENITKEYEGALEAYNRIAREYELRVGGRTVIEDEVEYAELRDMHNELERIKLELEIQRTEIINEAFAISTKSEELGSCRREPLGVVESVEIYW